MAIVAVPSDSSLLFPIKTRTRETSSMIFLPVLNVRSSFRTKLIIIRNNARMMDNLNLSHTSSAPENGCRIAAFPHPNGLVKENQSRTGGWELDGEIAVPYGQRSKRKRHVEENKTSAVNGCCGLTSIEGELHKKAKTNRCWSYGCISVIGRRREMEDAVAVELGLSTGKGSKQYDFFGVYDGHGGSLVAHACRERLHKLLMETVVLEEGDDDNNTTTTATTTTNNNNNNTIEVEGGAGSSSTGVIDWEKVMLECFNKMDEEVNKTGPSVATMGSTAVVAVIGEEELVVANCGDSRAVLRRGGVAAPLSTDHKPDRADELERIELCGGKVINWNGQRVLGVLATSRSIGDEYLKPFVIPVPQVTVIQRTSKDEFVIIASDGLWDVIPNDLACQVVRKCLNGQLRRRGSPLLQQQAAAAAEAEGNQTMADMQADGAKNVGLASEAAALLAEFAMARGSKDNISVMVVQLEKPKSFSCRDD